MGSFVRRTAAREIQGGIPVDRGTDLRRVRDAGAQLAGDAARVRRTSYPDAETFAAESILEPPAESAMLDLFTNASFP